MAMDEVYAAALRAELVDRVQTAEQAHRWPARVRRRMLAGGAALALVTAGGGIAYATGVWQTPPGGSVVAPLASPVVVTGTGTRVVDLGRRPARATAISISFTCLTPGHFGIDGGAAVVCSNPIGRGSAMTDTLPLPRAGDDTRITASPGARWRLIATYASVTTTPWKVNASGQTYGVQNQRGTPDLIAAEATDHRLGYVYATQLRGPLPSTPAQAAAADRAAPRTITVYEANGRTPVGSFVAGR